MDASAAGLYYKHSGKFSVTAALYATVIGAVIGCLCAFVYAYIIVYCPIVYLNALIAAGFGALMGYVCSAMLQRKKVRSDAVAIAITLVVTSIAYYFSWSVWVWAMARRGDVSIGFSGLIGLVIFPKILWEAVSAINEQGAWTVGHSSSTVSGWALWLVWLAEFGMIYGISLYSAYTTMDELPFCETCDDWANQRPRVVEIATSAPEEFKQRAEAKDFRALEELGAPKPETVEFQRIDLFSCLRCGSFHTMDSTRVKIKIESGKRKEDTKNTIHHLILTASEAEALKKLGEKLKPAVSVEPAKAAGGSA